MKIILIPVILLFLLSNWCLAQENILPINSDGIVQFTEVIESSNNKDVLYANAKEWIAKTFGDYKRVIQFEDNSNFKLIMKGNSLVRQDFKIKENISYTITIECKDKKFRYTIEDIIYQEDITISELLPPMHSAPTPLLQRIQWMKENEDKIKNINVQLDNLKERETSLMKKKELRAYQDSISQFKSKVVSLEGSIELEVSDTNRDVSVIKSIAESLKNAMSKNNDF